MVKHPIEIKVVSPNAHFVQNRFALVLFVTL